ncbi:putrescine-ornithine antiporter [Pseudomonas umsongensis]|jgi:putrescine:ornithine antiporter|uniref:Putrescine transporter PotE n=1 Tax=Pseudomonas umsongensis TaxID=198618 RepID=A0AAE7DE46_9PSED|nr:MULTISPECIES: putrescine-ornithine antiporter [Pseudomonas]EPA96088.1 amino acid transporter [Pseudomonas sp. G5(2012)]MBT9572513.1 putrescine-ornithine antiporter [Pseudomonas umsongensis]OXR34615.1 putrescine-ornithine antiporter [Pseudomonas umsongensis]QFG29655.1 putrescine-ornithine antiporter [Pseudomonas umsongensis]QJC79154.1 putrescine-ornithine antiporter [Pseudomonas umsongensis]
MSVAKKMSVGQLTMLTAVNMLGSGIVLLPSKLAEVGSISILSWLITATGSLALAYAFARCGMLSRKTGGMGGYAEYTFGKAGNYITNYTYGLSLLIANVAISITAVGYIQELFHIELDSLQVGLATIALLWITTFANFGGARITGRIGAVTVWGVIAPVVLVSTIGWFWFDSSVYAAGWNPHNMAWYDAAGASVAITLWAFLGLESACANTDAVENPEKNVPIAVLGGTLGAAVIYIVSTNVIAGIVDNPELAASTAPFGLVFAKMFTPLVGDIVMAAMVLACIGSLLGWQFTIAQVYKSSADTGYFLSIFAKANKAGTPIVGMLVLLAAQTALGFLTISPDLSKQFDTLVNLAVVTNLVPYILSMAALMTMQKVSNVPAGKALATNIIAWVAAAYSYLALYSSGEQALMLGGVATIFGYTLFGFVNNRLIRLEALNNSVPTQTVSAQHITGQPVPVNSLKKATLEIHA